MDNVRILKGYSKQERKELEEAKDNDFNDFSSAITLIRSICDDIGYCHALSEKYCREDPNDNNQMAKDIADFYCGNAKFPEQKYVVHDSTTNQYVYYSFPWKGLRWGSFQIGTGAEKKTKEEWLAINPSYEPMLESVED